MDSKDNSLSSCSFKSIRGKIKREKELWRAHMKVTGKEAGGKEKSYLYKEDAKRELSRFSPSRLIPKLVDV